MWSDVMQRDVMFCFVFLCFMSVCVMLRIRDLQHSIAVSGHWDRYGTRKRHQCRGGRKDLQTNALTTFADTEADQLNSGSNFIHKPDETKCLQHVKSNFWLWLPVQTFSYSLNCLHMPAWPVWLVECHQAAILASLARAQGPELNWRAPPRNWRFQREGNRGK
jgi:hypothetical protein